MGVVRGLLMAQRLQDAAVLRSGPAPAARPRPDAARPRGPGAPPPCVPERPASRARRPPWPRARPARARPARGCGPGWRSAVPLKARPSATNCQAAQAVAGREGIEGEFGQFLQRGLAALQQFPGGLRRSPSWGASSARLRKGPGWSSSTSLARTRLVCPPSSSISIFSPTLTTRAGSDLVEHETVDWVDWLDVSTRRV